MIGPRFLWTAILVVGIVPVACGEDRAPIPSGPSPAQATMEPARDDWIEGQEFALVLVNVPSGVQVSWSSSDATVVHINEFGEAKAVRPGTATITASWTGAAVTRRFIVVADFRGRWSGLTRMDRCEALVGGSQRSCQAGGLYPITLELTQTGRLVTGGISLYREPTSGAVEGEINESGDMTLRGFATNVEHGVSVRIEAWSARILPGEILSGGWSADVTFATFVGQQRNKETYSLVDVVRLERPE